MKELLARSSRHTSVRLTAAFLLAFLTVSCATTPQPTTPEEIVAQRAGARWDALIAGNWEKAYSFGTPAYRNAIDVNGFRKRSGGQANWLSREVRHVGCKDDVCTVLVRIGFRPTMPRGLPELHTDFEERWVFVDGDWWVFLRQ